MNLDAASPPAQTAPDLQALGPDAQAVFEQRLARLTQALDILPDKPEETPASALRALWLLAAGHPMSLHAAAETPLVALSAAQIEALDGLIGRRVAGEPIAYLTGWQRFMGLELLASPEAFGDVIERMADAARPLRPTRIVAAEARGFLFAAPLAQRLGVGLAPVRKPGKLPCEAFEASYDLEYGSNTLCLHKDALTPEDRVLIVDDILATGGTLDAMIRLVGQSGATVAGCCMLMELDALGGRKVLGDIPLSVLLHV